MKSNNHSIYEKVEILKFLLLIDRTPLSEHGNLLKKVGKFLEDRKLDDEIVQNYIFTNSEERRKAISSLRKEVDRYFVGFAFSGIEKIKLADDSKAINIVTYSALAIKFIARIPKEIRIRVFTLNHSLKDIIEVLELHKAIEFHDEMNQFPDNDNHTFIFMEDLLSPKGVYSISKLQAILSQSINNMQTATCIYLSKNKDQTLLKPFGNLKENITEINVINPNAITATIKKERPEFISFTNKEHFKIKLADLPHCIHEVTRFYPEQLKSFTQHLEDIAEVFTSSALYSKKAERNSEHSTDDVYLIRPSEIIKTICLSKEYLSLDTNESSKLESLNIPNKSKLLMDKDILLVRLFSSKPKIIMYVGGKTASVVDSNIIVIRAKSSFVDPDYLFEYLKSTKGEEIIEVSSSQLNHTKNVSIQKLKDSSFKAPNIDQQREILKKILFEKKDSQMKINDIQINLEKKISTLLE